ncbi:MAG UNVERIFIED_CONTAM: hypothetical protein LVR18_45290 [Planctomycetaceae bacterium]
MTKSRSAITARYTGAQQDLSPVLTVAAWTLRGDHDASALVTFRVPWHRAAQNAFRLLRRPVHRE